MPFSTNALSGHQIHDFQLFNITFLAIDIFKSSHDTVASRTYSYTKFIIIDIWAIFAVLADKFLFHL